MKIKCKIACHRLARLSEWNVVSLRATLPRHFLLIAAFEFLKPDIVQTDYVILIFDRFIEFG